MGIKLAQAAAVHGRKLNGNAFKVLNQMALMALDRPNADGNPAELYYGGWKTLALAIGRDIGSDAERRSAYESVRRALADLERKGLIDRMEEHPRHGTRQTFRLLLVPRSPHKSEGHQPQRNVGADTNVSEGHQPLRNVGSSPYKSEGPRKEEDTPEDLVEEPSLLRSEPLDAVSPSTAEIDHTQPHSFVSDPQSDYDECRCTYPRRHPVHIARSGAVA